MNAASAVQQVLNQPWTWFAIVCVVLFIWKIPTWKAGIENRLLNVEKAVDKAEKAVDNVEKAVGDLSKKVDEVYSVIINRYGRALEHTASPVTLTEYGEDIFNRIDAENIVNKYTDRIFRETQNLNAYQIQEHCFLFCKEKLLAELENNEKDIFEKISEVAFEDGIHLEKIMRVIGIPLRDRVLSMQGKSHLEVDRHSPPTEEK